RQVHHCNLLAERRHRMCAQWIKMSVCTALFAVSAMAQDVTTTGGSPGIIPEFNGKTSLANSTISEANRLVGIGVKNESGFDALLVSSRCFYCPSARSDSSNGGGIGMMGVVAPGDSKYAWAESDYWISNPAATTPNLNLWGVGAEGYYSDSGQI